MAVQDINYINLQKILLPESKIYLILGIKKKKKKKKKKKERLNSGLKPSHHLPSVGVSMHDRRASYMVPHLT